MGEKVLVTGGAGYIGSHTCKLLKERGYDPVAYDNLVYGHRSLVKWGPLVRADILDKTRLQETFMEYNPVAVIHFAAFAYVGESVVEPGKYYINNVVGTLNVLEAMRIHRCNNFIFSSTCATFGVPEALPITETAAQQPINPYGRSKLMIEQMLQDYDNAYGIKHVSLRYFNAAGADLELESGEDHTPETHLIPLVLEAANGDLDNIKVYGTDYDTYDGTAIRDYIHVTDLALAHLKSLELIRSTNRSDHFNLGTGTGFSVQEIINTAQKICDTKIQVIQSSRRIGDPPILIADTKKAKDRLGWSPNYSGIETIIETAWDWYRKRHGELPEQ